MEVILIISFCKSARASCNSQSSVRRTVSSGLRHAWRRSEQRNNRVAGLDRIRGSNVGGFRARHVHEHCLGKILALEVHFLEGWRRNVARLRDVNVPRTHATDNGKNRRRRQLGTRSFRQFVLLHKRADWQTLRGRRKFRRREFSERSFVPARQHNFNRNRDVLLPYRHCGRRNPTRRRKFGAKATELSFRYCSR